MNRFEEHGTRALELKRIRRARSLHLSLAIAGGTVVLNAAAYLVYASIDRSVLVSERTESTDGAAPNEGPESRAHRMAGLEAMAREDFEAATAELRAALRSPHPHDEVPRLLALVRDLRAQQLRRASARDGAAQPAPAGTETSARTSARSSARSVARDVKPPEPEPDTLILVTTVPDALTVKVDGEVQGTSPARIEVEPGPHVVAVFRGERRLLRRSVSVEEGSVAHVNADLRRKLRSRGLWSRRTLAARSVDRDEEGSTEGRGVVRRSRTPVRVASVVDSAYRAPAPPDPDPPPVKDDPPPETRPRPKVASKPKVAPEDRAKEERRPEKMPEGAPEARPPKKRIGRVPAPVLRKVIDRQGKHIRACYTAQLRRQLGLEADLGTGRVVIHLLVSRTGEVRDGRIKRSTLKNRRVERCIENVVRKLDFPPLEGPAEATFAMRFGAD